MRESGCAMLCYAVHHIARARLPFIEETVVCSQEWKEKSVNHKVTIKRI